MSRVNIKRAVDNIRASTTVYTPLVEMIVNAIQAIDEAATKHGRVSVRVIRDGQLKLDDTLPEISGFEIEDNGIGFTDKHRNSFDILYTDHRISEGGKGFGRFTCLKYFQYIHVDSVYRHGAAFKSRSFDMGKKFDIVVKEKVKNCEESDSGSRVTLKDLKKGTRLDTKLNTVARNLVERLLPFFISENYSCPEIILSESDGKDTIILNNFVRNEISGFFREILVKNRNFCTSCEGI